MDFERLADLIPKLSNTWTVDDTLKWLDFTGLQMLTDKFSMLNHNVEIIGIDGSCLHSLTEDDLREELGVSSKIMLKKMMACTCCCIIGVQTGFANFD
jgi:hypothetical protein